MTLNDIEDHSLIKGFFSNGVVPLWSSWQVFHWHSVLARSSCGSWASCLNHGAQYVQEVLCTVASAPTLLQSVQSWLSPSLWLLTLTLSHVITYSYDVVSWCRHRHYSNCTLSRRLLFGLVKDEARGDLHCARMLSDTLFRVFIECRLDWCNSLLYGVPENLPRKVQSVQNAAARLLTNTRRRDHITTPVLRQLHWLPIQRRVEFKIACMAHQSLTSTAPTYLSADIQLVSEHGRRNLRSSSYRTLAVPCTRTTLGDGSFAVAGPHVWNSLPATIRQITSYGQFRQHMKWKHIMQGLEIAAHCDSWLFCAIQMFLLTYLFTQTNTDV